METGFLEKVVLKVDPERWLGFGGREEQGECQAKQTRGSVGSRAHQHLSRACFVAGAQ